MPPLAVCANGAMVFDSGTGQVLAAHVLEPATLERVAEAVARALPSAALAAERIEPGSRSAMEMEFVTTPRYEHAWEYPRGTEVPDAEIAAGPAVKLLVRAPGMGSAAMRDLLAPEIGGYVDLTFSTDDGLVEIAAPGVTKARGLSDVAADVGVAAADVIAFGDMPNDVSMLSWAQHGVAMKNAHPELLTVADEVTASNNDSGVALVLERWWG